MQYQIGCYKKRHTHNGFHSLSKNPELKTRLWVIVLYAYVLYQQKDLILLVGIGQGSAGTRSAGPTRSGHGGRSSMLRQLPPAEGEAQSFVSWAAAQYALWRACPLALRPQP